MPNILWPLFYEDRGLLKPLDLAVTAIANVMEWILDCKAIPGVITLHTYGNSLTFGEEVVNEVDERT